MKLVKLFLMSAVVLSVAVSCQNAGRTGAKRLFVIGLDGTSSKCFDTLNMPFMAKFLRESSYSLKKRSVLPSSSAINWCTMFMSAASETHGYTEWGSKTPEIPSWITGEHGIFPTVFTLYRQAHPDATMGCIYDWDGMKYIVDTLSFDYHAKTTSMDDPKILESMAIDYIRTKPDVGVFVYDNPDHAGHTYGWDSVQYHRMLASLDKCVENIITAIKEEGMYEESMIVIISDHGGIERGHGGKTFDEIEAPAIFEGPGIRKGYCMDGDWCLHQYDVGATIARAFGLELPQACCGKPADPIFD